METKFFKFYELIIETLKHEINPFVSFFYYYYFLKCLIILNNSLNDKNPIFEK